MRLFISFYNSVYQHTAITTHVLFLHGKFVSNSVSSIRKLHSLCVRNGQKNRLRRESNCTSCIIYSISKNIKCILLGTYTLIYTSHLYTFKFNILLVLRSLIEGIDFTS